MPGPIAGDQLEKLYFTGTDTPRVTTNDVFNNGSPGTSVPPASYILGIPAPVGPPVATDNGGGGNLTNPSLTWVYTFVRKFSDGTIEESAPSVPSNALNLTAHSASVTMPNGAITHANYGITHKRLYRDEGNGFMFVSESVLATSPVVDNVLTANLGDLIDTIFDLPPPDGMIGLIALSNGVTAGFMGNVVYLSAPYRPHSYPLENQYAVNLPIVGLGNVGTTIIVTTTGRPHIGRGVDPAAYVFKKHPGKYPCISKRSIASSDLGVLWAVPGGMAVSDGSTVNLATQSFLTRKEWQDNFAPTTLHGTMHDDRYYGWFDDGANSRGGIILDLSEYAFLVNLADPVDAAFSTDGDGSTADDLWIAKPNLQAGSANYVYQFDADPSSPLSYTWKSKLFITNGNENYGVAQVHADFASELTAAEIAALEAQIAAIQAFNASLATTDGAINEYEINGGPIGGDNVTLSLPNLAPQSLTVVFRYYVGKQLVLTKILLSSDPFPLPSGMLGDYHEVELLGTANVLDVTLAHDFEELGAS